jgi:hypothetical protein
LRAGGFAHIAGRDAAPTPRTIDFEKSRRFTTAFM